MTSSPTQVALNPLALEYFPSPYPFYYIFFVPQIHPFTLYNFSTNYHQTHIYHAPPPPPPPPPPPTAAPPQAPPTELKNDQEMVQSHQLPRFSGACSRNKLINKRVEKIGYKNEGGGACRVVHTCVMPNRRPKPVMPLTYGEENLVVGANITTVMIKNLPNKFKRDELLTLLDKHCMLMNEACKDCGDDENFSAYDFVYLPMDFKSGLNKGYAFVNFTNKRAVKKFHNVFHNKAWDGYTSPKICEIVCAKIQGKEGLVKHFGGTLFICSYDEYLPVCFTPPRDGSGKAVELVTVGKRSSQNLTQQTNKEVWEGKSSIRSHSWGTKFQKSL